MTDAILRRIAREIGGQGVVDAIASGIGGAELKSLLLHVMRERARARSAPALLRSIRDDAVLVPCTVDQRQFREVDGHAFAAASAFEAVELSPLQPLGTASVLGAIDQNSVLSATRGTEVAADPTNALALIAALRRAELTATNRRDPTSVRLCTSQRVVRMQPFVNPDFTRHFRLFVLVTAGRDVGSERFEMEALREHAGVYLTMLGTLADSGYRTGDVEVQVADARFTASLARAAGIDLEPARADVRAHDVRDHRELFRAHGVEVDAGPASLGAAHGLEREAEAFERVRTRVFEPIADEFPGARTSFDPFRLEGNAYYSSYCLRVVVRHPELGPVPPADGGFTTWTARALANNKERLLVSGIGTEFLCKAFAPS